ncbi:MAG: hypothetical protein ICV75_06260 [Nitrospiraceae bacterium]|nr:hypothetical protein [Nitrospiraceae bacterium]
MITFVCSLMILIAVSILPAAAQVVGDDAELARLRLKGEEAIAHDDPDGAAMMMGRAALLAAQVAKKQTGSSSIMTKANEALFRSQEHTYRAMALFRRAGGQLPASSGVCGSLALASDSLRHAAEPVADPGAFSASDRLMEQRAVLQQSVNDWTTILESMIAEYQCP